MRKPQILAIEPDFIKEIVIKNFKNFHDNDFVGFFDITADPIFGKNPFVLSGEEWKEKRSEITPAFTSSRLRALYSLIDDTCDKMTKYLIDECKKKPIDGFDCRELAAKFTTDSVSSCVFGAQANSFSDNEAIIRQMGTRIVAPTTKTFIYMAISSIFPVIRKIWKYSFVPKDVSEFFVKIMKDAIDFRMDEGSNGRADYLNYLMELKKHKNLKDIDLASHGITFFVDGFDTSSVVMAHACYEIGRNLKVQEKLRDEINEYIKNNGKLNFDLINEMPYLNQVFYETLRLHPPGTFLSRRCTEEIQLDGPKGKKILIEKGTAINIPIRSIQRDPEYYENPEEFLPERFDPATGGIKPFTDKCVLMPFGDGPRICLGMKFALILIKAGIVEIVKNFKVSVNCKTKEPFVLEPKHFLAIPIGGIWLDIERL